MIHRFFQDSPPAKQTSTSTLLRKNIFGYTSTPVTVVFEEVCTPSQFIDPEYKQPRAMSEGGSFIEPCPRLKQSIYSHIDDSCAYQHYSINASECIDTTHTIMNIPGIDLSRENGLDQIPVGTEENSLYKKINFIDETYEESESVCSNSSKGRRNGSNVDHPATLVHITDVDL